MKCSCKNSKLRKSSAWNENNKFAPTRVRWLARNITTTTTTSDIKLIWRCSEWMDWGAPNETVKSNEEGDLFALTEAKYGVDQREETGIMEERHDSCRCWMSAGAKEGIILASFAAFVTREHQLSLESHSIIICLHILRHVRMIKYFCPINLQYRTCR